MSSNSENEKEPEATIKSDTEPSATAKSTVEKDQKSEFGSKSKRGPSKKLNWFTKHFKKFDRIKKPTQKPKVETESISESVEKTELQKELKSEEKKIEPDKVVKSILRPETVHETKSGPTYSFEDFVDERILISHDIFGKKEMKIKVLEVSDEPAPLQWKLGDRVKVNKILVTVKHLETQQVEEAEFDIELIEKELAKKRHYTSTNRWVPTNDIKNGYVVGSRHTSLISDAIALEYIAF